MTKTGRPIESETPFAKRLKALKVSETRLAEALGVHRNTVLNWVKKGPPRLAGLAIEAALKSLGKGHPRMGEVFLCKCGHTRARHDALVQGGWCCECDCDGYEPEIKRPGKKP